MKELVFVWDDNKDRINRRKHGISFEEAKTVFYDENAREYFDPDHSEEENRFILLGMSGRLRILVVCHCFRERELVIRILSARRANRREQEAYGR
jgi:uncharacterized protein